MSFPRYPKYKDSGVEWWGDMPVEWGIFPAKRSFVRKKELNSGMKCENRLSLTLAGVVPRSLDDLDGLQASEFETYQIFRANDLVFKLIDLQNIKTSRVGLVPAVGIMSPAYIRIEPNPTKIAPKFAYWFFTNLYNRCIFNELGGGVRQTISSEELLLLPYPALPVPEQTAIAAFLDRETAKIDELVAEQRRLMELLKEKRQAVISHAVTKGLNPHAPLKPSGIEWLGDVPAHWRVIKVGLISTFKGGAGFPDDYQGQTENEIPFFKVGDIVNSDESGVMRQAKHTITRETAKLLRAFIFPPDTIVFAKVGAALLLKRFRELGQPSCIDNNMMGMTAGKNASADFLLYVLPLLDFTLIVNPGAVPSINEGQISSQRIALPPLEEQATIVEFFSAETAKLDALTAEAQRAIDLLQERRTALISAAVTGQIDVLGVAG